VLQELTEYLKKFKEMTQLVSANQPHLGLVPLMKDEIAEISNLEDEKVKDHALIHQLKERIMENLDRRFGISPTVIIACLCDPSLRDTVGLLKEEQESRLLEILTAKQLPNMRQGGSEASASDQVLKEPVSKRQKLLLERRSSNASQDVNSMLRSEIQSYLGTEATPEEEENLLLFLGCKHAKIPKHLSPGKRVFNSQCIQCASRVHVL